MDWNTILSAITAVGFPIVACVAMGIYVTKLTQDQRVETKELNEAHTQEMMALKDEMMAFKEEIKEALNNNTIALTKLCDKLDREEK